MVVFIDSEYKCHTTNSGHFREVDTDFFDDKCKEYIEGTRFVPNGKTWTRADGTVFAGEMIAPWKSWDELDAAQREFEREQYQAVSAQNAEYEAALSEIEEALGV